MKNFKKDFLENQENFTRHPSMPPSLPMIDYQPPSKLQLLQSSLMRLVSPLLLSLITSPMNVSSIYMQLSELTPTSPIQQKLKVQPNKARYISNGLYGDNIIFRPQPVQGYRSVFQRMGKEGLRGFYKGNFTGYLFLTSNVSLRNAIFNQVAKKEETSQVLQAVATVVVCTFVDVFTYPLMTAQSRLVLQNSSPNFRTYSSFVDVFRKTPVREIVRGCSLQLPKNILMWMSWVNLGDTNPMYGFVLSSVLSHLTTYPFTTVMRRMQVQSLAPMMYESKLSISETVKQMWSTKGVRAFYRGFAAYCAVHGFTLGLVAMNQKSGSIMRQ